MNPWAIPSLIACIFHACLMIYVLHKNPKSSINRSFALILLTFLIWQLGEYLQMSTPNESEALFWCRFNWIGGIFIAPAFFYFASSFYVKKPGLLERPFTWIGLLVSGILFIIFLPTDLFISKVQKFYWGYTGVFGSVGILFSLYYAILFICGFYFLFQSYKQAKGYSSAKSKQILLVFTWAFMAAIIGSVTNFSVMLLFQIQIYPLGAISTVVADVFMAYAILKYKLFIIEPKAENEIRTPQKYILEKSLSYLIKEEKPDKGYEVFYDQITHGYSGLAITKLPPEKIRERYKIAKTPILWLTFKEVENAISPKDLEGLKSVVSDFVWKAEKTVILLDCFDQIMLANGFEKSISMIREIKDICGKNNANLLLSVNTGVFEKEQIVAIERELEGVKGLL